MSWLFLHFRNDNEESSKVGIQLVFISVGDNTLITKKDGKVRDNDLFIFQRNPNFYTEFNQTSKFS